MTRARRIVRARIAVLRGRMGNAEFDALPVYVQDAITDPKPLKQPPPRYDKGFWAIMELLNADARGA